MGIRPLFYYQNNGRLVFGSEIKAIFADKLIPRMIDTETLADIFICWSSFGSRYLLSSQGDRMVIGNSVEGRYPFLDHRVIEFACKIPPKYRMNGLKEKFVLKHAAKRLIPKELIDRPKQPYRATISESFFKEIRHV